MGAVQAAGGTRGCRGAPGGLRGDAQAAKGRAWLGCSGEGLARRSVVRTRVFGGGNFSQFHRSVPRHWIDLKIGASRGRVWGASTGRADLWVPR